MTGHRFTICFAQAAPLSDNAADDSFPRQLDEALHAVPDAKMVVFPEMHLFGAADTAPEGDAEWYRRHAWTIPGPEVKALGALARRHGVWLIPGTVPESAPGRDPYNTALVFSPDGTLVHQYRKVFPWRPAEAWTPGHEFTVFDIPGLGPVAVNICYDSWFPEVTRQLAWLGAGTVINLVKTTTPDRAQELVLARANAITNQVYYLSVNAAGPAGRGRSIFIDPQGDTLLELSNADPAFVRVDVDPDRIRETRQVGTAGLNRLWAQFRPEDPAIDLPAYHATLSPQHWSAHIPLETSDD